MPALVPSCCVTLDNVLCLSVPAAGQYKDNQRQRHKKPPENPHLPSLRGQGQGVGERLLETSENSADSLSRG